MPCSPYLTNHSPQASRWRRLPRSTVVSEGTLVMVRKMVKPDTVVNPDEDSAEFQAALQRREREAAISLLYTMGVMSSEKVRANWPAEISHSPHGECGIDTKRTDESPGFEQPAGGADCVGSGGRVDGCQHTPRPPHHDRPPGGRSSRPRKLAGNPDSPQVVIFLTSIIDVIRGC